MTYKTVLRFDYVVKTVHAAVDQKKFRRSGERRN